MFRWCASVYFARWDTSKTLSPLLSSLSRHWRMSDLCVGIFCRSAVCNSKAMLGHIRTLRLRPSTTNSTANSFVDKKMSVWANSCFNLLGTSVENKAVPNCTTAYVLKFVLRRTLESEWFRITFGESHPCPFEPLDIEIGSPHRLSLAHSLNALRCQFYWARIDSRSCLIGLQPPFYHLH